MYSLCIGDFVWRDPVAFAEEASFCECGWSWFSALLLAHEEISGIAANIVPLPSAVVSDFDTVFVSEVVWFAYVPVTGQSKLIYNV